MSADIRIKEDIIQEKILQAAQKLFQTHGLHKVTMDDVAKAIGKGRSSLYYYYKSKEEILDAVKDIEINEIIAEITKAVDQVSSVEQKIKAFCATTLKISKKRRALYSMMDVGMDADEMSSFSKIKLAIHRRFMTQQGTLLSTIIQNGISKGELRMLDQKNLDVLLFVLLSSLHGLKREMSLENDYICLDHAIDTWIHMIIHGLKK